MINRYLGDDGFSLVELIIVIAIMAILAGAIAPALIRYIDNSKKSDDIATAEAFYDAACLAISNPDIYDGDEGFHGYNTGNHIVTNDKGETYTLVTLCWMTCDKGATQMGQLRPGNNEQEVFTDEVRKTMGIPSGQDNSVIKMKYKKDSGNGVPHRWLVCRRKDNDKIEIWLGSDDDYGQPIYQLQPELCKEYR